MCSKVLNGHIILTDTSITTILAPEMTYTPKNYYLGLVYSRIGEVYSEQMNFNGALEYYRNAYGAWENYASLRL